MKLKLFLLTVCCGIFSHAWAQEINPWCAPAKVFYEYEISNDDCTANHDDGNYNACIIHQTKECQDGKRDRIIQYCVKSKSECLYIARDFEEE